MANIADTSIKSELKFTRTISLASSDPLTSVVRILRTQTLIANSEATTLLIGPQSSGGGPSAVPTEGLIWWAPR